MSYQPVPGLGKDWLTPFYDMLVAMGGLGGQLTKRVLFLKEAGFAVQELPPKYKGVHFLLATKDTEAQERGKA